MGRAFLATLSRRSITQNLSIPRSQRLGTHLPARSVSQLSHSPTSFQPSHHQRTIITSRIMSTHHNIVALEGCITPIPDFTPAMPPGHTFTLTIHAHTPHSNTALIQSRLASADIALVTVCPLTPTILSATATPNLRFISVMASGHDIVHKPSCHSRGIIVSNSPGCNVDAVAEHSVGLYFSLRRRIPFTQRLLRSGAWTANGYVMDATLNSPDGMRPLPMRDEVVGILGNGAVGRRIGELCAALGMKSVLVTGRKGAPASSAPEEGRTAFGEVLRTASVLFICVPRTPETMGLLSTGEFAAMQPHAVIVNVSRGGIVDEAALVEALKGGRISGAATDVFQTEPAGPENSVLLGKDTEELNLVATPHVAWASRETTQNYQDTVVANVRGFLLQKPQNVVS
ncbi:glycerate dehydrogenase [Podospora didyma]|uniref:Glycerate dehydrogenase n=1 Tax=Podospora didyma TaxID=330526 RepID=A0AAE0U014_9PEZI|nr:glycerate dehydrogenase [Podospora didyma]